MSRILKDIFKNDEIVECQHCGETVAYTKDDIQTEKTVERSYWGSEHWERNYVICPNCGEKINGNWH